ncbi:uncharacterized protein PRCAT00002623001 [Priceomyces carsonii]|uniref:uncharacterized protein n=1 Tax=Priceomyces carsonii TaxID=28549 RepID=UPI002EDAB0F0|nr:unnamed protein product [Priceomyces carsonii]
MLSTRGLLGSRVLNSLVSRKISSPISRLYSDQPVKTTKKKKTGQTADISQVPIKSIGVIADFYVPPKYLASPVSSWLRLFLRRMGLFAINTYSVVKYRRETGLKLKFNDWKEQAIEKQVKANKIFAAACNLPLAERERYLKDQLNGIAGDEVLKSMVMRAVTFPPGMKLTWDLISVESNPKIVSFNCLPDSNNITTYIQFVVKVRTKQKVTLEQSKNESKETERVITDNLVYTLNPFSDETVLVGSLFDSDSNRGVQPEINFTNSLVMVAFQKKCADIFRSNKTK